MYRLLRPHHSMFLLENELLCKQFIQLAEDNIQISKLLPDSNYDLLLQWRLAFNLWIYFKTDDEVLFENNEKVMIYPTLQYLVNLLQKQKPIIVFKINYKNDEQLLFIAASLLTTEFLNWYNDKNDVKLNNYYKINSLLKTDFYQAFQVSKTEATDAYPKQLTRAISAVYKDIMEKTKNDEKYIIYIVEKAIQNAKSMHNFLR